MKKFIGLILVLCLTGFLFGQDQPDFPDIYIDAGVGGTHVGSLANPYDDLSDINWSGGGDNSITDWYAGAEDASAIINLNRGDTWLEQLTPGASGSATYPIIIQSYGSGNKPVIDAANTRARCILVDGRQYITIDGLELKDATNNCAQFWGGCSNMIIKNCDVYHPYGRGIYFFNCSYGTIEGNLVDTTPIDNAFEADGIYIQIGSDYIVRGNTVYNKQDGQYVDCLQIVDVGGTNTIEYNWLENPDGYVSDTGSLVLDIEGSGTFNVRYNVLLTNDTDSMSPLILAASGTYNVYNNIVVNLANGGRSVYMNNHTTGWIFKNNIFYATNGPCIYANQGIDTPANFDYNCYYRTAGADLVYDNGADYDWAEWQTEGAETNGINAEPKFVDLSTQDYRLLMASPCVDAGTDVSLTTDYRGRSIRHAPDIGAYEDPTNAVFMSAELLSFSDLWLLWDDKLKGLAWWEELGVYLKEEK